MPLTYYRKSRGIKTARFHELACRAWLRLYDRIIFPLNHDRIYSNSGENGV